MVIVASLCLVVMAISAWEATQRARNIIVILHARRRTTVIREPQAHQG